MEHDYTAMIHHIDASNIPGWHCTPGGIKYYMGVSREVFRLSPTSLLPDAWEPTRNIGDWARGPLARIPR